MNVSLKYMPKTLILFEMTLMNEDNMTERKINTKIEIPHDILHVQHSENRTRLKDSFFLFLSDFFIFCLSSFLHFLSVPPCVSFFRFVSLFLFCPFLRPPPSFLFYFFLSLLFLSARLLFIIFLR